MTYTTKEIINLTGFSRSKLAKLRNGYTIKKFNREYVYNPILIENTHYIWHKGKIQFTDKIFEILKDSAHNKHHVSYYMPVKRE